MNLQKGTTWILLIFFLLLRQKHVHAVNCYICSWNPQDKEVEADRCSTGNFDESKVSYINCQVGCKTFKILDSNGELLMFYRNCLSPTPYKYTYSKSVIAEKEMFPCYSDLCNASVITRSSIFLLLIPLLSSHFSHLF